MNTWQFIYKMMKSRRQHCLLDVRVWAEKFIRWGHICCGWLFLPMGSKHCNTTGISLWTAKGILLKNKPHLVPGRHGFSVGPVGWGCRTHRLHLCRRVRPHHHNECPGYDTKQSDGVAPVMLELWGNAEYLFIAIAPWSTLARSGSTW